MSVARPQDIVCKELVELLTDFLEQHLVWCPGCSEYLRQFRATIGATRKLAEEDLPEGVKENLLDAFRHWRHGS